MAVDTGYPKAGGIDGVFVSLLSWNKLSACVLIDFLLNSSLKKKYSSLESLEAF